MTGRYKLDGHKPVKCGDETEWAKWFQTANRHVAFDVRDGVRVSTVFLGTDHCFGGDGPPILFETMIFGGPHHQDCERYSTWEAAEAGHAEMCKRAFPYLRKDSRAGKQAVSAETTPVGAGESSSSMHRCGTCRFFTPNEDHWGECHRYPPVRVDEDHADSVDGWDQPIVTDDQTWCGEHTSNIPISAK